MEKEIGKINHYFDKVNVVAIKLEDSLKVGDRIHIVGRETDFEQFVTEMQMKKENVQEAVVGQDVGLKIEEPCKKGDKVYLVY